MPARDTSYRAGPNPTVVCSGHRRLRSFVRILLVFVLLALPVSQAAAQQGGFTRVEDLGHGTTIYHLNCAQGQLFLKEIQAVEGTKAVGGVIGLFLGLKALSFGINILGWVGLTNVNVSNVESALYTDKFNHTGCRGINIGITTLFWGTVVSSMTVGPGDGEPAVSDPTTPTNTPAPAPTDTPDPGQMAPPDPGQPPTDVWISDDYGCLFQQVNGYFTGEIDCARPAIEGWPPGCYAFLDGNHYWDGQTLYGLGCAEAPPPSSDSEWIADEFGCRFHKVNGAFTGEVDCDRPMTEGWPEGCYEFLDGQHYWDGKTLSGLGC